VEILKLVDLEITKGTLGDMFRAEDHPNYVGAGNQILRKFLDRLIIYLRGERHLKVKENNTAIATERVRD
jgi:uncharacterized protein YehS (DUF1456 family)